MEGAYISREKTPAELLSEFAHVLQHFRLDMYMNPDGRFIELRSSSKRSPESQVNHAISNIDAREWRGSYLYNRLREAVVLQVLNVVLSPTRSELSSVVNDVHYGVDATISLGSDPEIAVDFTEGPFFIKDKLANSKNGWRSINTWQSMPLMVFYVDYEFISSILVEFNQLLLSEDKQYGYGTLSAKLQFLIFQRLKKDLRPDLVCNIFFSSEYNKLSNKVRTRLRENLAKIMIFKNPPPSR